MPTLVEDVARSALAAIDTDAGLVRAVRWTSERYRELSNRANFRHLRKVGEINLPAPIGNGGGNIILPTPPNFGLATVTRDSNVVVGDATSSPFWTSALIGRHFRAQVTWYEIVDVVPSATAAQLILKSNYAESPVTAQGTTNNATISYLIVQRFTKLPDDVRYIGDFVHMRRRRRLRPLSVTELDQTYPARNNVTGGPRVVTEQGVDADGHKIVEMYPYNDLSEQIRYVFWQVSRDLQISDVLPVEIDLTLLKRGVLVDVFRYEMAKAARLGKVDAAALWRNEMRAQVTEWERAMQDAIRADKGQDDVTLILRTGGVLPSDDPLITTAHDEVLARWPI